MLKDFVKFYLMPKVNDKLVHKQSDG